MQMKWFLAIVGILVLLGMIAGAGVGLWWWLAPEPPVASRSFLVQSHREVIFRDPRSPSQIDSRSGYQDATEATVQSLRSDELSHIRTNSTARVPTSRHRSTMRRADEPKSSG